MDVKKVDAENRKVNGHVSSSNKDRKNKLAA